jgi:hypothetical protein
MNWLLNQEGIATIRSSLETCIRLGKYALPICALVAAFTSTRSLQKLLLQLLLESSGFTKKQIIHIVFQLLDAFRTTLITLTT